MCGADAWFHDRRAGHQGDDLGAGAGGESAERPRQSGDGGDDDGARVARAYAVRRSAGRADHDNSSCCRRGRIITTTTAATTTAAPQQQVIAPLDSLDDSVSGSKVTAAQRASIMTKLAEKAGMDVPAETLKARHVHVVVAMLLLCWRLHLDCISAISRCRIRRRRRRRAPSALLRIRGAS